MTNIAPKSKLLFCLVNQTLITELKNTDQIDITFQYNVLITGLTEK